MPCSDAFRGKLSKQLTKTTNNEESRTARFTSNDPVQCPVKHLIVFVLLFLSLYLKLFLNFMLGIKYCLAIRKKEILLFTAKLIQRENLSLVN